MAIRCKVERASEERPAATETNQNLDFLARPEKLAAEGSGIVNVDSVWPNSFQISVACVPHLEKVYSDLRQKKWSKIRRRHERPRHELVDMENVYVCNVGCSSSSWTRLFGEFTFYQKPDTTNDKTIVRSVTEVDHRSNRGSMNIKDWLAHTHSWQSLSKRQVC